MKVRNGPSLSSKTKGVQKTGSLGTIIRGPVTADGYTWWDINYDTGSDGWSAENWLAKVTVLGASTSRGELINSLQIQLQLQLRDLQRQLEELKSR